jgi:hypothetical protein
MMGINWLAVKPLHYKSEHKKCVKLYQAKLAIENKTRLKDLVKKKESRDENIVVTRYIISDLRMYNR